MELESQYADLMSYMAGKAGELRSVQSRRDRLAIELEEHTIAVVLYTDECEILRITGEILREGIKKRVENLVTSAIRSVFGREDYRFELEMELKRGQMTATPMLINEFRGTEIRQPVMDSHGGGLVNVISFVLQAVVLALTRPKLRKMIFLDETFKNVRDEIGAVGTLLRKLQVLVLLS